MKYIYQIRMNGNNKFLVRKRVDSWLISGWYYYSRAKNMKGWWYGSCDATVVDDVAEAIRLLQDAQAFDGFEDQEQAWMTVVEERR